MNTYVRRNVVLNVVIVIVAVGMMMVSSGCNHSAGSLLSFEWDTSGKVEVLPDSETTVTQDAIDAVKGSQQDIGPNERAARIAEAQAYMSPVPQMGAIPAGYPGYSAPFVGGARPAGYPAYNPYAPLRQWQLQRPVAVHTSIKEESDELFYGNRAVPAK